jgi:hypothetical protein
MSADAAPIPADHPRVWPSDSGHSAHYSHDLTLSSAVIGAASARHRRTSAFGLQLLR